jgi:phosphoribosylformylglycinamidine (FGAM) synthase-like amidotransferase family enzyme
MGIQFVDVPGGFTAGDTGEDIAAKAVRALRLKAKA